MSPRKNIDLERVVQTAIEIANEQGYEAVTLALVAEKLEIRVPSLYNHVAGLPGLRYQMRLWGTKQLTDQLRRAAVGKAGKDAILSVAKAYRAFAQQYPGIYAMTLRAPNADETELAIVAAEVLDIVIAVLQPYGLSDDDMLHAVRGFRSISHGFVDLDTAGGFGMALDKDESFRRLVEAFIQGMAEYGTQP